MSQSRQCIQEAHARIRQDAAALIHAFLNQDQISPLLSSHKSDVLIAIRDLDARLKRFEYEFFGEK